MDPNDLLAAVRRRYESSRTEELLRVAGDRSGGYSDAARRIAAEVLVTRGVLSGAADAEAEAASILPEAAPDPAASLPLGKLGRAACFLWCGVPALIAASYFHQKRRRQAMADVFRFMRYGWVFRFGIVAIMLLAMKLAS